MTPNAHITILGGLPILDWERTNTGEMEDLTGKNYSNMKRFPTIASFELRQSLNI